MALRAGAVETKTQFGFGRARLMEFTSRRKYQARTLGLWSTWSSNAACREGRGGHAGGRARKMGGRGGITGERVPGTNAAYTPVQAGRADPGGQGSEHERAGVGSREAPDYIPRLCALPPAGRPSK